ncbi:MAG: hypothetical protein M3220_09480, partial [Chloroflexota bacterium]|nr:hypothetical protein [Chloroflexota bacterium]
MPDNTVSTPTGEHGSFTGFLVRIRPFWPVGLGLLSTLIGILLYNALFPTPTPITQEEIDDTIVA